MPDLEDVVDEIAQQPAATTVDGLNVQQHNLKDLDEIARRRQADAGVTKSHRGLRFNKLVPPGTT